MDGIVDVDDNGQQPGAITFTSDGDLQTIEVGDVYESLEHIKQATQGVALAGKWTIHVKKRDRMRIIIGCRSTKDCPFHIRAEAYHTGARISSISPNHTCVDSEPPPRQPTSSFRFLIQEIPKLLEVTKKTPVTDIQASVARSTGHQVPLQQCRRAKAALTRNERVQRLHLDAATINKGQAVWRLHKISDAHNLQIVGQQASGVQAQETVSQAPSVTLDDEDGEDRDGDGDEAEDDDEDEETLQLQIQMIQAKLKLKRLQKKRKRAGTASGGSS